MEKRIVLFLVASAAVMFGWLALQAKYFPPPPQPPPAVAEAPKTPPTAPGSSGASGAPTPGATPPAPGSPSAAAAVPAAPEKRTTVERPRQFRAVFSSHGAAPVEFRLRDPQYQVVPPGAEEDDQGVLSSIFHWFFPSAGTKAKLQQIELVRPQAAAPPFTTWLSSTGEDYQRSDVALPKDAAWTLESASADEIVYSADAGDLHFTKRWRIPQSGYALGLDLTVENRGAKAVKTHLLVSTDTWHDPNVKQGGITALGRRANLTEGLCEYGEKNKLHHGQLEALLKEAVHEAGGVDWVGYGEQFFVAAAGFKSPEAERACDLRADGSGRIDVRATFPAVSVAPGGKAEFPMVAFIGPKHLDQLERVQVAGTDPHLDAAVDYTLDFIARPMLWVLKTIHRAVPNWGVAVIVITILLKLVTLYPTQKSMESAKRMAKLKPEMDKIKERFPDDKVKQSQLQQELWKKHGINPLGGCLPMLFQMPIYIAFYSMLSNAVELYRASFVWPINDMTAPAPAVALVTGALMFVQQLTSPQAADPQQRQMMYMTPIMFMAFTLFLPSGLTLYILTNTLLAMAHQWWMNRHDPKPAPPTAKPARA